MNKSLLAQANEQFFSCRAYIDNVYTKLHNLSREVTGIAIDADEILSYVTLFNLTQPGLFNSILTFGEDS